MSWSKCCMPCRQAATRRSSQNKAIKQRKCLELPRYNGSFNVSDDLHTPGPRVYPLPSFKIFIPAKSAENIYYQLEARTPYNFMYGLSPGELVPSFDRRWRPGVGGEVVEGQCIQSPAYGPRQLPYPACPCAIIHTCSTYPHPAYACSPAQPQVGMQNHHQRVRPLILLTAVDPQRQPCLLEPMSLVTVKSQNINTLKLR